MGEISCGHLELSALTARDLPSNHLVTSLGGLRNGWQALQDPWLVLPAEVLHGVTFAAMRVASTAYANQLAPGNTRKHY